MTRTPPIPSPRTPYNHRFLAHDAHSVMAAFYRYQNNSDLAPYGFDLDQAFEFFLLPGTGHLKKRVGGGILTVTSAEEARLMVNLQDGWVELYLRQPRLIPGGLDERTVLHCATGTPLKYKVG